LDVEVNVSGPVQIAAGNGGLRIPTLTAIITNLGRVANMVTEFLVDKEQRPTKDVDFVKATSSPKTEKLTITGMLDVNIPESPMEVEFGGDTVNGTVSGHWAVEGASPIEVQMTNFTGVEIHPGEKYTAFGVKPTPEKDMGGFQIKLMNPNFAIDIELDLKFRIHIDPVTWGGKWARGFDRTFQVLSWTFNDGDLETEGVQPFTEFIFHAAEDRLGNWSKALRHDREDESLLSCAPIEMRPTPILARGPEPVPPATGPPVPVNGLVLPPAGHEINDAYVFTFLDAAGQVNNGLLDLLVAGFLSPFPHEVNFDAWGTACFPI
jgi:hypothetical protein